MIKVFAHKEPCRCNCGYTCNRECGLPVLECMEKHFKRDCDHKWDGPTASGEQWSSVTCSLCGEIALTHDCQVGP